MTHCAVIIAVHKVTQYDPSASIIYLLCRDGLTAAHQNRIAVSKSTSFALVDQDFNVGCLGGVEREEPRAEQGITEYGCLSDRK